MRVTVSARGTGREDDLRALHRWLEDDAELRRGGVSVTARTGGAAGRMGFGPDELDVVIAAAAFVLELAKSVRSWLKSGTDTSTLVLVVDEEGTARLLREQLGNRSDVQIRVRPADDGDAPDEGTATGREGTGTGGNGSDGTPGEPA